MTITDSTCIPVINSMQLVTECHVLIIVTYIHTQLGNIIHLVVVIFTLAMHIILKTNIFGNINTSIVFGNLITNLLG